MTELPSRPDHLPDYTDPPLTEVVLGVQFNPATGYQQIRAGEVWGLYKSDFPFVEEQQPLPPAFETFGLLPAPNMIKFGLISGALHDRFWFVSDDRSELIQFQQDRLLHNWRKDKKTKRNYPRFEAIFSKFESELQILETYFNSLSPQNIISNQAEISYINCINLSNDGGVGSTADWFRFIDFASAEPNEFNILLRRVLLGKDETPYGRLICEVNGGLCPEGERTIILTLTVRGAPRTPSIRSALDFLKQGRDVIVQEFTSITTDSAHQLWGRIR